MKNNILFISVILFGSILSIWLIILVYISDMRRGLFLSKIDFCQRCNSQCNKK